MTLNPSIRPLSRDKPRKPLTLDVIPDARRPKGAEDAHPEPERRRPQSAWRRHRRPTSTISSVRIMSDAGIVGHTLGRRHDEITVVRTPGRTVTGLPGRAF